MSHYKVYLLFLLFCLSISCILTSSETPTTPTTPTTTTNNIKKINLETIEQNANCELLEDCRKCGKEESQESFCQQTGYKKVLVCKVKLNNGEDEVDETYYKSCTVDKTAYNILYFEMGVGFLFLVSVYFVRERKRSMTMIQNEKITKQLNMSKV
ncbi:hypothetical protein DLAC_06640 [Tieghemostelium lacteum]|uniref:Transmembrane protein n=1 Tax=Tieghemostelium lacteum TaxID=361077 RepID=A0A151ZFA3_TIELA|nr:hypothetical protein DLAC_06640 [Tieghemostelium lacteum]|eukprot:KYQ92646.1 hypothetical protein DLAC_06640 [Tieghemostelium lacteum]